MAQSKQVARGKDALAKFRENNAEKDTSLMALEGEKALAVIDDFADVPKATHSGRFDMGAIKISCSVLEDGTRVIGQGAFLKALGRHPNPNRGQLNEELPAFLSANNLAPFITEEIREIATPIPYRSKSGGYKGKYAFGYRAELIPLVCQVYLDAKIAGVILPTQEDAYMVSRTLNRAFSTIGITALIDEVTGYQEERDKDALQKILAAYISPELLPWTKRFPNEFYQEMFRLRKWQWTPMNPAQGPRYAGKLTNEIVYEKLPPGVLEKLRELNPVVDDEHLYEHHRFLTEEIGNPHLEKHLAIVTALMRISPNWRVFMAHFARAFRKPDEPQQQEFEGEDWQELEATNE